ncbi:MAG TPA: ChbG/HpnK family deacetylase, partial [Candidatus Limnocylindria bacterium]|nr:ChbG/HpnK family deacetylase [Candidatus Limnocylindria bacterium]
DEHIDVDSLVAIVARIQDGVSELMCHPGEADAELLAGSAYARERERELATLTDARVRDALERGGVTLTTFAAL